ncbi:hypothetical protein MYXO_03209 [Myxococcaceae bacterium]|nr:hypothetical protein MYXO_03209 [Myxococcaceae bacterium]
MAEQNQAVDLPEAGAFENKQLDLFRAFLCNNPHEHDKLSNALDLWDSIPRYSVSRRAMDKTRKEHGMLPLLKVDFHYKGTPFKAVIRPARIEHKDGTTKDYYPSANEELVEDALRKIAAEQQSGFFDKSNYRSGVVFTLYMLRQELKRRGHTRSYQEITLSLDILSLSVIDIRTSDDNEIKDITRSGYFPGLAAVSKNRLAEDPNAKWVVQFHPLVTQAIDALTYRQFNYAQMMSYTTQLARWLHKQLSLKYTFASMATPFEMRYSTIKRDSHLLEGYGLERKAIAALDASFHELKSHVLLDLQKNEIRGPRGKLLDVAYKFIPSPGFVAQMKAANKRQLLAEEQASGPAKARHATHNR